MAVRADGSTDRLSRTGALPTANAFTMMGWFKVSVDRNDYSSFLSYGTGATKKVIQTNGTGTTLVLWDGMFETSGSAMTVGTWTHLAITFNGTNLLGYVNGVLDITGANGGGNPGTQIEIFQSESGEWLNGCGAAIKIYSAVLTAAEIQDEMRTYLPVRFTNLNSFYPLLTVGDDQVDFSGAGLTLTVGGTLATEDGPPIPWKGRGRRWTKSAAAGGGTTLTPSAGVLALAGQNVSLGFTINIPTDTI